MRCGRFLEYNQEQGMAQSPMYEDLFSVGAPETQPEPPVPLGEDRCEGVAAGKMEVTTTCYRNKTTS